MSLFGGLARMFFSIKHVYSVISELCEVSGSGEDIFLPLLSKV